MHKPKEFISKLTNTPRVYKIVGLVLLLSGVCLGTIFTFPKVGSLFGITWSGTCKISDSGSFSLSEDLQKVNSNINLDIYCSVPVGDITYELLSPESSDVIQLEWVYEGKVQNAHERKADFIQIGWENNTDNIVLNITNNDFGDKIAYDFSSAWLSISFSSHVNSVSIDTITDYSNVKLDCQNPMQYTKLNFQSIHGDIDLLFNHSLFLMTPTIFSTLGEVDLTVDHSTFEQDLLLRTAYSKIAVDFWNIRFSQPATIDLLSETGGLYLRWAQHKVHGNNVSVNMMTQKNIDYRFWALREYIQLHLKYESFEHTSFVDGLTADWVQLDETEFQTPHFQDPSRDHLNLNLISTLNDIYLRIVDCFKMQRFCRTASFQESLIRNTSITGEFYLDENLDSSITQIRIHNQTANAPIDILSASEGEISPIAISWDLTYRIGSGYGLSNIKVNISYEIDLANQRVDVYISLDYQYDRIRPIFIDGGILIVTDLTVL